MPLKPPAPICFGARVSPAFRAEVRALCVRGKMDPNYLMAIMAFETGLSFDPAQKNKWAEADAKKRKVPYNGAIGLIQFMKRTAEGLGTTSAALAKMDAVEQLAFVEKYFKFSKGVVKTLSDCYMAVLWPGAIGKPEDHVIWDRVGNHPIAFIQNAGLDWNKDGKITKAEAAAGPAGMLVMGRKPENLA